MSIRGKVENDTIKLPDGVHLPNGTEVIIEPTVESADGKTFAERYANFIGIIEGPGDMAENLDHYLYGAPEEFKVKPLFVDAFFYVALLDKKDSFHHRAVHFASGFRGNLVTSQWVLIEVANSFGSTPIRKNVSLLIRTLEVDPKVRIFEATPELFRQGLELYSARPDKQWSLTDCLSFCIMKDEGLSEALTRDHHFAQAGFVPVFADPQ